MRGRAERLVDDDVAALGAERHLDGVGEDVDAAQHAVARVGGKAYVFGSHVGFLDCVREASGNGDGGDVRREPFAMPLPHQPITPMMSDSFMIRSSWPSILTSVPLHLPNSTLSPALTSSGDQLAALVAAAGADGDDFAFLRLLLGGVRDDDAALRLLLAFEATDDDAVMQGTEFHESELPVSRRRRMGKRGRWVEERALISTHLKTSANGCAEIGGGGRGRQGAAG